ncbi:hypothetical protein [uncultured Oscillibacter sp.]|uniref:ribbon-helix-helix domain-containing protein n=1 Tax=uncultured Oscillibacter sp. TaxID=876091 RepID=UPI0025E1CD20|nr:hypothetical protein [uncultured Oscillibacter sp.]
MGLAEREAKRAGRGVVASIIHAEPTPTAAGKGRPKSDQETKQRISLAILPSLYEDVKKLAYVERRSVSELVAQLLERYIRENQKKLEDYGTMNRDP